MRGRRSRRPPDLYRQQDELVAAGRALTRLALVVHRLGDPGSEQLFSEARDLLEEQPPGPELVSAYAYTAGRHTFANRYSETIAFAERALALATELDLPEPAFALHWRGVGRCALGDAEGLEDSRRALQLALEQNLGREAAVIYANLGGVVWSYEGPRAALDAMGEAIAFCERRGITEMALQTRSAIPAALAELGQTEQALAEAGPLADRIEAGGDMSFVATRALQVQLLAECGAPEEAPTRELVATARDMGFHGFIVLAFAAVAQLHLAQGRRAEARTLLQELDELAGRVDYGYMSVLPSLMRVALALDDEPLARRLASGVQPATPRDGHAVVTAEAQLAEAAGDHVEAASMYAEAADSWQKFGNVPERAYALLGQGRCLAALGKPGAEGPLREARELFASMGYRPALSETEALLAETAAAAS